MITLGDPRGIGPDVAGRAIATFRSEHSPAPPLTVVGDDRSLASVAATLEAEGPGGSARVTLESVGTFDGSLESAGQVSADAIRRGVELISGPGNPSGTLVTGPVHKPALHAAGVRTPGQTEFLGRLTGAPSVGMLMHARSTRLGSTPLRILLATTHLPLRDVPQRITQELLATQIRLLDDALRRRWRLQNPVVGLCGLNPHASDEGLFGDEEARVMEPVVRELVAEGRRIRGPLPADTIFGHALAGRLDAVAAPYHDVGMAVFKTLTFGRGVNVTLGLPFLRTSPDNGTAFDLVGTGRAEPDSMLEAIRLAAELGGATGSAEDAGRSAGNQEDGGPLEL